MKKFFVPAFVMILIMLSHNATAQSLDVKYTVADGYPYMVSGFTLMGPIEEIRNDGTNIFIKKEDVEIYEMENGQRVRREVLSNPECPKQTQTTFSAVLTVDISTSMSNPSANGTELIDIVKEVLRDWIRNFDPKRCETAITAFCGDAVPSPKDLNKPIHTFTTDKDSLLQAVDDMPALCGGTNYNAAFLYRRDMEYIKNLSALWYCKPDVARFKPVIIFLTDGNHLSKWGGTKDGGAFQIFDVATLAKQRNATIYVIVIGQEVITQDNIDYLNQLALIGKPSGDKTSNIWMNINDADELKGIYEDILAEAGQMGSPPPCYANWKTSCEGGSATFTFPNHGNVSDVSDYTVNPLKKPNLNMTQRNLTFIDKPPTSPFSQTITLKAEKNFIEIDSLTFKKEVRGGRYKVTDWGKLKPPPITIEKDSSYQIVLEYTPVDSNYSAATLDFDGFACTGDIGSVYAEMRPFVEPIFMGNVNINDEIDSIFTMVFCNKTGKRIKAISKPTLTGTNADNFEIVSPTTTFTVDTGACQTFTFKFKPKEPAGTKTATINIRTDYGGTTTAFTGPITGNAIGGKTILHTNPGFGIVDCNNDSVDVDITLENAGAVTIKNISCSITQGASVFTKITDPKNILAPKETDTVKVRFKPTALQNSDFTGTLTVTSDADNSPYDIPLAGPMRNIAYTLNPSPSLNYGDVCVGTPETQQITIKNDGNVDLDLTLTALAPFSTTPATYTIAVGGSQPVDVICTPLADGVIASNFDVKNTECNITKSVALSAMGVKPLIQLDQQISLTAVFGDTDEATVVMTNKSASKLNLQSITPVDPTRFTVSNINPTLPKDIDPNGTVSFKVSYSPLAGDAIVLTSGLQFIGTTCSFDTTIVAIGNPGQATVNIEIEELTGFDGQPIDFPVYLRSGNKFDQSNTTKISTDIRYDASLLEAQAPFVPIDDIAPYKIIKLVNKPVLAQNNEQIIETLKFLVKKTGTAVSTPLEILNTSGDGGAQFIKNDGLFTLAAGAAEVSIESASGIAGEDIGIKVKLVSQDPLPTVNENIMAKVSFNASMLEPIGSFILSKKLDNASKKWIVEYKLPLKAGAGNVLAELHFNTMLGNDTITDLTFDSLWVAKGSANLTPVNGRFTLNGICKDKDGTTRLFNPFPQAAILSLKPNPSDGMVDIIYETSEEGHTRMWVSDMLGNPVMELVNQIPEPGEASLSFDGTTLSDGIYFVILQTPTQVFRQKMYIVR